MQCAQDKLRGQGAELMQAVPNMLEIVPSGVNKRVGLDLLLEDLGLAREAVMAIGDGGNDLHIVSHAGIGVAMGNAVPEVSQSCWSRAAVLTFNIPCNACLHAWVCSILPGQHLPVASMECLAVAEHRPAVAKAKASPT